jgi:hypothetical protein
MEQMGISPDEDYNSDAILFQQGYNMYYMEIEPGEKFKIKKNKKGQIDCSEIRYKFIRIKKEWETDEDLWDDEYEDSITLSPGYYKFLEDEITIEELEKNRY